MINRQTFLLRTRFDDGCNPFINFGLIIRHEKVVQGFLFGITQRRHPSFKCIRTRIDNGAGLAVTVAKRLTENVVCGASVSCPAVVKFVGKFLGDEFLNQRGALPVSCLQPKKICSMASRRTGVFANDADLLVDGKNRQYKDCGHCNNRTGGYDFPSASHAGSKTHRCVAREFSLEVRCD